MRIRKNDTVRVMSGNDKGKEGKVLKVFPDAGGGAPIPAVVEAITYATDNGASVINMSLGGAGAQSEQDCCWYAY